MAISETGYIAYRQYKLGAISLELLKIEVKLLLSANRKSYMPHRLAQQRMTLSDLEWPFHASCAISALAELVVCTYAEVFPRESQTSVPNFNFLGQ